MREWARLFEFASRIEEKEVAQPLVLQIPFWSLRVDEEGRRIAER